MRRPAFVMTLALAVGACGGDDGDDPAYQSEHPRILLPTQRERLAAQLETPAGRRFVEVVDRWTTGREYSGFEAWNAALLGQLTGDAKYCDAAVKWIDAQVSEAQSAIASGEAPDVAHDSYLGIGESIGDLALVYDWCHERVGDRRGAWLAYAQQAVWNVWHHEEATWGGVTHEWSGWATDNPSNNYHYSFLRATMLLGLAAHGEHEGVDDWLVEFRDRRVLDVLIPTFEADLVGGGSREGTGYGVSLRRLFDLYTIWKASTGEDLATKTGHTRASMLAFMHQTVPTLDRIAPTGDHSRDSEALFFDYHRDYLQKLVTLFPDDPLSARAQALVDASSVPEMETQFMYVHDYLHAPVTPTPLAGMGTAYYAPGIGQLYARSSWDKDATWVNLIAGPYTESHAHQDQGSLMIFKNDWLVFDANVTSQSGLHQETEAHSLVRIVDDGETVEQRTGTTAKLVALHRGNGWLHAAADITPAYKGHAAVQKVEREIVFVEPDTVVVYDRVATSPGTQQIWQLATPTAPTIEGAVGRLGGLVVQRLSPTSAGSSVRALTDEGDFSRGSRFDTVVDGGGDQRYLHVLWHGSAVTDVTPLDEGATLTLAGGQTARVQFRRDAIGGTLVIDGETIQLGAGVDSLPE